MTMNSMELKKLEEVNPKLKEMEAAKDVVWVNPHKEPFAEAVKKQELTSNDIRDAEERLKRFAPLIMKCFPETEKTNGIIESPLTAIPKMQQHMEEKYQVHIPGRLFLKQDNALAIAGSVKARGGIYEVLKHTEDLALEHGLLKPGDSYDKLASPECREFFSGYTVQVGSTGNLGMSIGIMSAAIGYKAIVHMSADARQWKKDLLRKHGVTVKEYQADYGEAVKEGRALSDADPKSYFVDDENSQNLFLGYAVAASRLEKQFEKQDITVDEEHPLFVYIPCGVGGAPGGIAFGLKQKYGDNVHCFFVEPVQAPAMLLGMMTGLQNKIAVTDIGLSGLTEADGLAVGRPSGFVGSVMEAHLSGEFTLQDYDLYRYMKDLLDTEGVFLEPSACAMFTGPRNLCESEETAEYIRKNDLADKMMDSVQLVWATGGSLVPDDVRENYVKKAESLK
ncbi:MAG: D-serine ammonia-lyase [Eubacterium sp.]|nr:D-serine ammonia-lyase [Eubacterium sp.]MCH4047012.1 D-serine ammonia-lyase [Eubacterium sp.]MCH4080110.1 D-serine ammonia-lyase [Eubacterium sp.]MCI1306741.1 D-serine ammonia-lyase [Eubacterium sp.]MCI1405215.1 D-serine ammonia-lyase [Eubacterium sp.]